MSCSTLRFPRAREKPSTSGHQVRLLLPPRRYVWGGRGEVTVQSLAVEDRKGHRDKDLTGGGPGGHPEGGSTKTLEVKDRGGGREGRGGEGRVT